MPVDPYPYEDCCEHGFNAHARDHCLLCDCARQPRLAPTPPPTGTAPVVVPPGVLPVGAAVELTDATEHHEDYFLLVLIEGSLGVLCCKKCGSLVGDPAKHTYHHGRTD